jgi:hypothetical protein
VRDSISGAYLYVGVEGSQLGRGLRYGPEGSHDLDQRFPTSRLFDCFSCKEEERARCLAVSGTPLVQHSSRFGGPSVRSFLLPGGHLPKFSCPIRWRTRQHTAHFR